MIGYVCDLCGYEYVSDKGDVENGVAPMTQAKNIFCRLKQMIKSKEECNEKGTFYKFNRV